MDEWSELHRRQAEPTPFMHPCWARVWWRHYGAGAGPYIVRAGEGLAPFTLRRHAGQRVLGAWGSEPGDYWDVLADATSRAHVAAATAEVLVSHRDEWDAVLLRCVQPGSPFEDAMRDAGAVVGLSRPIAAPAIELPQDFEAFLATLPARRRSNVRRHLRRLDTGEVTLREVRDPTELPATFDLWQRLRVMQWAAAGGGLNPEHARPRFRDFLCEVAQELVPRGHALVWEFRHADEVVGVYLNFTDAHSFYWYLGGFDMKVASLGLGKIAIAHGIRTSIEARRQRFDFGRGAEAYKYWFGAHDRTVGALLLGTSRPRSQAVVRAGAAAARLAWLRQAASRRAA